MSDKAQIISDVTHLLSFGDKSGASAELQKRYPFEPVSSPRSNPGKKRSMQLFLRDRFLDRYSGERLVFPGAMLVISTLLPNDFPTHPNWKMDATHFAYYELWPVLDHVQPVTRGGGKADDNLVTTSAVRNSAKSNFTLEELGWPLLPVPAVGSGWDGLTSWFLDRVRADPSLLSNLSIKNWFDVASKQLSSSAMIAPTA